MPRGRPTALPIRKSFSAGRSTLPRREGLRTAAIRKLKTMLTWIAAPSLMTNRITGPAITPKTDTGCRLQQCRQQDDGPVAEAREVPRCWPRSFDWGCPPFTDGLCAPNTAHPEKRAGRHPI